MNSADRRSFESFCKALQHFPTRLVERPHSPIAGVTSDFMPCNREGNTFVNRRQLNFWSIVHVGAHGPFPLSPKKSGSHNLPASFQNIIVHRFQLRYADIPIDPIIEVMEPYPDSTPEVSKVPQSNDPKVADVRWFNTRVANAVRATLTHRRHSWPRFST